MNLKNLLHIGHIEIDVHLILEVAHEDNAAKTEQYEGFWNWGHVSRYC